MMVIDMGTRISLLLLVLAGCTSTAMAQTSTSDTDSQAVPTRYTLISLVDNGDMTVATVPAVVSIPVPTVETVKPAPGAELDGGDGISDSPDATDKSTSPKVRID